MGDQGRSESLKGEPLDRVIAAFIRSRGADEEVALLERGISEKLVEVPAEGLRSLRSLLSKRAMSDRHAKVVMLIDHALEQTSYDF